MNALDPRGAVVLRALDLLRLVSGAERAYLVGAGKDPRLDPLLTSLGDPDLNVSRSSVEQVLRTGEAVSRFMAPDVELPSTESMSALGLRRIWVKPVLGNLGQPVAAVYLDSTETGDAFDEESQRLMDAVVEEIGMALRNASLHAELVSLNEGLERRVVERHKEEARQQSTRLCGKRS